jgi:hypothetical protein
MANHSSASLRNHTPHSNRITRTQTIMNALIRRAQAVLNDESIDAQSRAVIRRAMERNDPWLARLVRRADASQTVVGSLEFEDTPENYDDDLDEEKVETLSAMICRVDGEPETRAAALLVLMATLENSAHPKALANAAKHLAFTRCGQLNLYGMIDAQIAVVEDKLLAGQT